MKPYQRGDVVLIDIPVPENSHVQGGNRPWLIVQNNVGNQFSPTSIIVPLTTKFKKLEMPTHVPITWENIEPSMVECEQVRVVDGKPMFYDPPRVKEARRSLSALLSHHRPSIPLEGPISLRVLWLFPKGKTHRNGEWRITKPDTDNLQKMLKDCMTRAGFWNDDAQVVREIVEKRWSDEPVGIYIELEELEDPVHV